MSMVWGLYHFTFFRGFRGIEDLTSDHLSEFGRLVSLPGRVHRFAPTPFSLRGPEAQGEGGHLCLLRRSSVTVAWGMLLPEHRPRPRAVAWGTALRSPVALFGNHLLVYDTHHWVISLALPLSKSLTRSFLPHAPHCLPYPTTCSPSRAQHTRCAWHPTLPPHRQRVQWRPSHMPL